MADYGLPALPHRVVESAAAAREAAAAIGWPVAVKTAKPGLFHKSDAGGVRLGLADAAALDAAYAEMAARLGPRVLVMRMAGKGIELSWPPAPLAWKSLTFSKRCRPFALGS